MLAVNLKKLSLILFLFGMINVDSFATHLRAGSIHVEKIVGDNLTYRFTITVFTNTQSTVLFGNDIVNSEDDILYFGDGTFLHVPETPNTLRPDLGPNIGVASFTVLHTYANYGAYLVSYREPNRNEGILNMDNSVNTQFYTEIYILLEEGQPFIAPESILPPILRAQSGQLYTESLAQSSLLDDQLIYQLTTPKSDRDLDVENYRIPENLSIDPISGLLSWDTNFMGYPMVGEFSFAVKTYQIRNNKVIGYTIRDFQIVVTDEEDSGEIIKGGEIENGRVFTPENSTINLRVEAGSKVDAIDLVITSELEQFPSNFSYVIEDSIYEDMFYKVGKISFMNSSDIVRTNPYIITARATFDSPQGKIRKDLVYVVATKDIYYELPLILDADDEKNLNITLYPNPVHHFLQIDNPERRSILVTLFDIEGKAHIKQTIRDIELIDVSELPAGLYVCTLLVNGKMVSKKIVKE